MAQPKPIINPRIPAAPPGSPIIQIPKPIIEKRGAVGQKKQAPNITYPTQGSQPKHFVTSKLNSIKPVK